MGGGIANEDQHDNDGKHDKDDHNDLNASQMIELYN